MPFLKFNNVGITALSASVPAEIIDNSKYTHFLDPADIKKVIEMTGIKARRFADAKTCSSDLCIDATKKLVRAIDLDIAEIDALIFVSQTPDYRTPPSSMMIAHKLGLSKNIAALDVNLGCSGYIYGLQVAFLYASQTNIRKVLLLNGETKSKAYSSKDKSTSLLFGDAGTATLVESTANENPTIMSANSNGSGYDFIIMPGGGYRKPSSLETITERTYPDGSIRSEEHGTMDGESVFNFTITDVPKDIKSTMNESGFDWESIDFFVPHQANKFITDHIARKLKFPSEKVLYSMHKYGNTSSVSIPLTICDCIPEGIVSQRTQVIMSGFGVGLSWGTVITDLRGCVNCGVKEFNGSS